MMAEDVLSFSAREAAYVGGITERQLKRVLAEKGIPPHMIISRRPRLRFAPQAGALAAAYYNARKTRHGTPDLPMVPSEGAAPVGSLAVGQDATARADVFQQRIEEVSLARHLIHCDPAIMGGRPVFAGSRVLVETVLASLDEGESFETLRDDFPILTDHHTVAARAFYELHSDAFVPMRPLHADALWQNRIIDRRIIRRDA